MASENENSIAKREHDHAFGVKKTSTFLDDGNGHLVRQAINGLNIGLYDYISNSPTSTTDVLTYKTGGASGTVIATVTIEYTDSTKDTIQTLTRT